MPDVTLSLGPSPYGDRLVHALLEHRLLRQVMRAWPALQVERAVYPDGADGHGQVAPALVRTAAVPLYAAARRLTWGLWRRLPGLGHTESPRAPLYALYDEIARRHVAGCGLFAGFAQVSWRCLRQARALGIPTLLEHPMSHAHTWMAEVEEELARFGTRGAGCHSRFPRALVRRMEAEYAAADRIVVPSAYARRSFLRAGVPAHKLVRVPPGVDLQAFRPAAARDARRRFQVLYVGRLELLKGVQYLLQAVAALPLPDLELHLIGRVLPEMRPVLRRWTDGRVRVHGPLEHGDLPARYRAADVFVFPSVNDAFELVTLEAMASGLPVIASAHSGAPDVLAEGGGFVVPPRDPAALAARIAQLYEDRDEARALGQAARRIAERHGWARYGADVAAAYPLSSPAPAGPH